MSLTSDICGYVFSHVVEYTLFFSAVSGVRYSS